MAWPRPPVSGSRCWIPTTVSILNASKDSWLWLQADVDMVSDNLLLCFIEDGTTRRMIAEDRLSAPHLMSFQEFVEGSYYDTKTLRRTGYNFMHPMIRSDFIERCGVHYIEGCRNGEDIIFYFDCLAAGARWFITPEPMYRYTVRTGSLTEVVRDEDRALSSGSWMSCWAYPGLRRIGRWPRRLPATS